MTDSEDIGSGSEPFVIDDGDPINSDVESDDDIWHGELEEALNDGFVDHGIIRNICKCRVLPPVHRGNVWKICLGVSNRGNALSSWDGKLDLYNQDELHDDCQRLIDSLDFNTFEEENNECKTDRMQLLLDVESILTFYCKSKAIQYNTNNQWTDILKPLLSLNYFDRSDLYNCFYAIISKYIPQSGTYKAPFHLFRLLLQYHDPELCSFLDSKKITTELYTGLWFSTLFTHHCGQNNSVSTAIWDVYFQRGDPYFLFFLALVILVNAKEQVLMSDSKSKEEIAKMLADFPRALEAGDIEDFCNLSSYYSDKTPRSFKREYRDILFGNSISTSEQTEKMLSQALCLNVSIPELLLSTQPLDPTDDSTEAEQVHFFMVDCRPPERYNSAHLHTAFHLDATLMLSEPSEFAIAISALFTAQQQAIEAGSLAGGEHLCFIGNGKDTEADQYMHMVVAHLLQKHKSYISVANGGFEAIIEYLEDVNINLEEWIVGSGYHQSSHNSNSDTEGINMRTQQLNFGQETSRSRMEGFMKNLTSTIKTKSYDLKEKAVRFIENQDVMDQDRHVRVSDHTRAYRGTQPVFSIGDEDSQLSDNEDSKKSTPTTIRPPSDDSDVDESDLIDLQQYLSQPDVVKSFACFCVIPNGRRFNAHIAIQGDEMVCLREYKKLGKSKVLTRRNLGMVTKITSKRSCPELITFKFGSVVGSGDKVETKVEYMDRYLIPDAGQATKQIKQEIVRVLDSQEENNQENTAES